MNHKTLNDQLSLIQTILVVEKDWIKPQPEGNASLPPWNNFFFFIERELLKIPLTWKHSSLGIAGSVHQPSAAVHSVRLTRMWWTEFREKEAQCLFTSRFSATRMQRLCSQSARRHRIKGDKLGPLLKRSRSLDLVFVLRAVHLSEKGKSTNTYIAELI